MKKTLCLLLLLSLQTFATGKNPSAKAYDLAENGSAAQLKKAVTGADLNGKNAEGNTLLMIAALGGNEEVVQYLLSQKVPLETKNKRGDTALAFAVANSQSEVAKLLISAGADVDVTVAGKNEDTLFIRALLSDPDLGKTILAKKKSVLDKPNKLGETALFQATRLGDVETLRFLLSQGANKTLKNKAGKTPLDIAKESANEDVQKALAKK